MRIPLIAALLVTALVGTPAFATVFKCIGADGSITYTNDPSSARNCERLRSDLPVSTVPAPPLGSATTPPRPAATSAPSFPRVSPDAQRGRDDARRQILERELASEQAALAEAQESLSEEETRDAPEDRVIRARPEGGTRAVINLGRREQRLQPFRDQVELHQRNIDALEREMRGLR